jgi:hypothetical protein
MILALLLFGATQSAQADGQVIEATLERSEEDSIPFLTLESAEIPEAAAQSDLPVILLKGTFTEPNQSLLLNGRILMKVGNDDPF